MYLQQIMSEAKMLVPPSADITDEQLVQRINQVQRKVYRELPLPDKSYKTVTTPGISFYDLPIDCAEDRIKTVLVDNQKYEKVSNQDTVPNRAFCTVVMDKLFLYPNPSNDLDLLIYYRPRYHDLDKNNPYDIPDLPEDYHELLVFGCAQWIASTLRDVDMVNNMQAEYDELINSAKKYFKQFTRKKVLIKEVW